MNYQITSALLGTALGLAILFLVRRDHLQPGYAFFWLAFALASIVFGLAPSLSDRIASRLGISYGPTLVLLLALAALILRSVQADIRATRSERELRRLTQRLAMLDADLAAPGRAPGGALSAGASPQSGRATGHADSGGPA